MSQAVGKLAAVTMAAAAGLAVLALAGFLTVDALTARRQASLDDVRIAELQQQGHKNSAFASELHAEYERTTTAALEREATKETLAWGLLGAAVVFIASAKWLLALRGQRLVLPPKLYALTAGTAMESGGATLPTRPPVTDEVDLSLVDAVVEREGRDRHALIPILQALQAHYRYLPEAALRRVCALTEITAAELSGVASFYTQFRRTPVGKHLMKLCHGTACHVAGAERITDELRRHLGIGPDEDTDPARELTIEPVACMGCCTLAPVAQLDGITHGHLEPGTALDLVARCRHPKTNGELRKRLRLPVHGKPREAVGEIRLGLGSCCVANGSGHVHEALQEALATAGVHTVVKCVGCVGMCHQTPLLEIERPGRPAVRYARVQPHHAKAIVRRHFGAAGLSRRIRSTVAGVVDHFTDGVARTVVESHAIELRDPPVAAFFGPQTHIATEHCGCLDPCDLDEYLRYDGFEALRRCTQELSPEQVIEQIRASGLRGRGGAGFPTAEKWSKVRAACGNTKYIICNGDEGDPGAFMDRMLMESYPYRIIEGVAIAAFAIGATEGVFYIRREYGLAVQRMREAIRKCEERGLLSSAAPAISPCHTTESPAISRRHTSAARGRGPLRLRVVEGAGAFVCGEETALIASLEGRRGMPTLRPPYPAQRGLNGQPTLVNNVETYAVVPWISRNGPQAFAALGTDTSTGTKVFALTGKVRRGGLIEVPMGITIRQIVEEIGGGAKDEITAAGVRPHTFKAVQIGGPSGGCIPAALADTPIDYEALADLGAIMGSGGLVVLDETDCMVDIARYFLAFTQDQSCGQCTPCRIGTRRMLEILERLCTGQGRRDDLEKLEQLARTTRSSSLCGLGQTAPNPVLTTLRYFREEYEAHLEGRCPARKCKALIEYRVSDACTGCTLCAQHCPAEAIAMRPYEQHEIDMEKCTRCDSCRVKCPEGAIEVVGRCPGS